MDETELKRLAFQAATTWYGPCDTAVCFADQIADTFRPLAERADRLQRILDKLEVTEGPPESPTPEPANGPTIPGWELLPSPVLASDLADSQQVAGRWYRPLWGCDSLAETVERLAWLRAKVIRLKQQLEETEHNLAEYRHAYAVVEKRAEQAEAVAEAAKAEKRVDAGPV